MVLTIMSTSLLMLFELISIIKKDKWLWLLGIILLCFSIFQIENVRVNLENSNFLKQNLWPVLLLYFHFSIFDFINKKNKISPYAIFIPVIVFFWGNFLIQMSIILTICFLLSKNIDKFRYFTHSLGLFFALINTFFVNNVVLIFIMYLLYTLHILYEIYTLKEKDCFDSNQLAYFVLNIIIMVGLSEAINSIDLFWINLSTLLLVLIMTLKIKNKKSKIIPLTGMLVIFYSVLVDIVEAYQVLALFCLMAESLIREEELLKFKDRNFSLKWKNNIRIILYLLSGIIFVKSIAGDVRLLISGIFIFCLYFILMIGYEKRSIKVTTSDVCLLSVLLIDVIGVIWPI